MRELGFKTYTYEPPTRKRSWFRLLPAAFALCMAATGGALVWDKVEPWSNPVGRALRAARQAEANTSTSTEVSARLLDAIKEPAAALRSLAERGDEAASRARRVASHWLDPNAGKVTIEQVRSQMERLGDAELAAWIRKTLR